MCMMSCNRACSVLRWEGMKKILFTLLMCVALAPVGRAEIDTDKVLDSVLKVGVKLLEKEAQKLENDTEMNPDGRKITSGVVNIGAKLLEKQRQEMLPPGQQPDPQAGDLTGDLESLGGQVISHAVKSGWDAGMTNFKAEVRQEQKELEDTLNARLAEQTAANDRMQASMDASIQSMQSMQWLCWGMLAALCIVLIAMVGLFWYIHSLRRRLTPQEK